MSRLWLPLLASSLLVSACVDERAFFIKRNDNPCVSGGADGVGSGVLDLQGKMGYVFYPEIVSELSSTTGQDGEPERNRLILSGFEVKVDLGQAGAALGLDTVLLDNAVPVFGNLDPGSTITTAVTILSEDLVELLRGLPVDKKPWILVTLRAVADHNGSTLKSSELEFPIQLCRGCLMSGINPGEALPDCPDVRPAQVKTNACGLPQDAEVFCCNDSSPRCLDTTELNALPAS